MSDIGVIFSTRAFEIPRYMIQYKMKNMPWYLETHAGTIQEQLNQINGVDFAG